jgi:hypothetical protein
MMRRGLLLVALAAAGCGRSHPGGRVEVRTEDCVICHAADFAAAVDPPHAGNFPMTCDDCHTPGAWRPAAGLHPEAAFPIGEGAHLPFRCAQCHDPQRGAYPGGANTSCVGCHTGAHTRDRMDRRHRGVAGYPAGGADVRFCLDCHPRGVADLVHPQDRFPLGSGDHGGVACLDCHKPDLGPYAGGANTDCTGCHTGDHARAEMDARHRDVPAYTYDSPSCLRCHPAGFAGDD